VGPLPPPAGGMANQTRQLAELLRAERVDVTVVQLNAPYRPRFVGRLRGIRALFRLMPYLLSLWRAAGRVDLFHIMANSGWSWHLCAAPAIWIAHARGVPAIVNYRGGEAATFLAGSKRIVWASLRRSELLVVPSGFLRKVFEDFGISSDVIPNILDLQRFHPGSAQRGAETRLAVTRHLEPIYDISTAIRAFALIHAAVPASRMTVAGSGPEEGALKSLCASLGLTDFVDFCGTLDRDRIAQLLRASSVAINPSRVDNMPNSVLEAMACGVPVVSTRVGGVPFIVQEGVTGLLVPEGDERLMADAVIAILKDSSLASRLSDAALCDVQQYGWPQVRQRWIDAYAFALSGARLAPQCE
jgi:glycosyltransferase involved in cell wall biosynthesis